MKILLTLLAGFFFCTNCSAQIKYVTQNGSGTRNGSSWTNAWGSQEWADNSSSLPALSGVWIAKGSYFPTKDANGGTPIGFFAATFGIPRGVKVYGGFAGTETSLSDRIYSQIHTTNKTTFSGDGIIPGDYTDNVLDVITMAQCGNGEILDGVTVSNGLHTAINLSFSSTLLSSVSINNCVITDNFGATASYAAVYINGNSILNASVSLTNSYLMNNYQGAVKTTCKLVTENCIFYANAHSNIGGTDVASCVHFINTNGTITNSTFYQNSVYPGNFNGYAVVFDNANDSIYINNSIFWKNYSENAVSNIGSFAGSNMASVKNCLFETQSGGTIPAVLLGSFSEDPVFVNENNIAGPDGEYNTHDDGLALSLCTGLQDKGNSAFILQPTDIFGNARIYRNNVDIGAHELQSDTTIFAITAQPVSTAVCEGSGISFTLNTTGPNIIYQWQEKAGTLWIDLLNGIQYTGINSSSLNILNSPFTFNGKIYRCKADNNGCPALYSNEVILTVNPLTAITSNPASIRACESGRAVFSVAVAGGGLTFQWQVNTGTAWNDIALSADYTGTTTSILNVNNLTLAYNGYKYRCRITANCGNIISGEALLTIVTGGFNRLYVDSSIIFSGDGLSWSTAFTTVDEAIGISGCLTGEKEIWIAKGTYYPGKDTTGNPNPSDARTRTFGIPPGIKVFGGFAGTENNLNERNLLLVLGNNRTILSGDIDHNPVDSLSNSYHVVTMNDADSFSLINGFIIQNGNADYGSNNKGGGIFCLNKRYLPNNKPVISTCLIRQNYAFEGGGIYLDMAGFSCYPLIENCYFSKNRGQFTGSAVTAKSIDLSGFNVGIATINKCVFEDNTGVTAGTVSFSVSSNQFPNVGLTVTNSTFKNNSSVNGSALSFSIIGVYSDAPVLNVANCVFDSNYSGSNGGAINLRAGKANVSNSTFFNNTAATKGGALATYSYANSSTQISNSIFWNNRVGSNISNIETTSSGFLVTVNNSLFQQQAATAPVLNNCLNAYPLFNDTTNRIGNDNIWGTSDDGLNIQIISTCKDGGLNESIPLQASTDITGAQRVHGCRVDMGAYENQSALYSANTLYNNFIQTCTQYPLDNSTLFVDTLSCSVMANVLPNGANPVAGLVKVCISNSSTVPFYNSVPYVQHHYDIIPLNNAANSTARITIYFTQQDFDNYNAAAPTYPQLPTNPSDLSGISHILIEQDHGISATSVPGTYNGTTIFIDPADNDIVWNAVNGIWEISFDVTGFSGFFLRTATVVPVSLLNFFGQEINGVVFLQWKTGSEINLSHFDVQRSVDGRNFETIATQHAKGNISGFVYEQNDLHPDDGVNYYRLKVVDIDGREKYSDIILVNIKHSGEADITISPNPSHDHSTVSITGNLKGNCSITIYDMRGRITRLYSGELNGNAFARTFDMRGLNKGIYILEVKMENEIVRKKLILQ